MSDFYDIDLDMEVLLKEGMLEDYFYVKNLKQRKLFLNDDINQFSVQDAVMQILQFNREDAGIPADERKPIRLYVNSNGGDVDAGLGLIDAIESSKTPVYTINLGFQYSMGFLIGLAGSKRFAMPNSRYLMHDGTNFVYNSGAKAQDQMEFNKRVEERVKRYVTTRTHISPEMYDKRQRTEWYMFADEAKELGVTDCIIGRDCDLDEVI